MSYCAVSCWAVSCWAVSSAQEALAKSVWCGATHETASASSRFAAACCSQASACVHWPWSAHNTCRSKARCAAPARCTAMIAQASARPRHSRTSIMRSACKSRARVAMDGRPMVQHENRRGARRSSFGRRTLGEVLLRRTVYQDTCTGNPSASMARACCSSHSRGTGPSSGASGWCDGRAGPYSMTPRTGTPRATRSATRSK